MRHNFTVKQQRAMAERSGGICEAGKFETWAMYGMQEGQTCQSKGQEFDHVVADALRRTKPQSIDEGLHVCCFHHDHKTQEHDMPKILKAKRLDDRSQGIRRQYRPILGSKASGYRIRMNGTVEKRT